MGSAPDKDARSQALFRFVNERIFEIARGWGFDGRDSYVCECGNAACWKGIQLTRVEYERVRGYATRFIVAVDHENPESQAVVEVTGRYAVVETYAGSCARVARETDPRSQRRLRTVRRKETERAGGVAVPHR